MRFYIDDDHKEAFNDTDVYGEYIISGYYLMEFFFSYLEIQPMKSFIMSRMGRSLNHTITCFSM